MDANQDRIETQGDRIRKAVEFRRMTLSAVATKLGMSQAWMQKLVNDRLAGEVYLPTLALMLDVPQEWLETGAPRQPWEEYFYGPEKTSDLTQDRVAAMVRQHRIIAERLSRQLAAMEQENARLLRELVSLEEQQSDASTLPATPPPHPDRAAGSGH